MDVRARRRWFLAAYGLSGAAALIYQVAWSRALTMSMGHTVAAVGTVLAAFMGGLAGGAAIGGRWATRLTPAAAFRGYATIELLVGAVAIAVVPILDAAHPLLAWAYEDSGGARFVLVRVALCLVVVALPAGLMGATLPFAVRCTVPGARRAGVDAGRLYAVNAVGAAVGAGAAGFAMLPALGLRATVWCGAVLNVAAALVALSVARGVTADRAAAAVEAQAKAATPKRKASKRLVAAPGPAWIPVVALVVSGFVALAFEVTWTRVLGLVLGPTTWAFSAMLCAFIAGIALGSTAGARIAAETTRAGFWLGSSLVAMAIGAAVASWALERVPSLVATAAARPDAAFGRMLALEIAVVSALLMPMAAASGAAFPLAVTLATRRDETVPRDVAALYVANTLGAIGGALGASFLLVPALGVEQSIRLAAIAVAVTGAVVAVVTTAGSGRALAAGLGLIAVVVLLLTPRWDRGLLASGAYKYAPYLSGLDFETALEAGTLLYFGDGAAGTVTVREVAGARTLAIDGKVDASSAGDMLTQKLLAHLPLLLHGSPRRVGIIGLGSGVTLGAALTHPIEQVDTLEVSREVVAASDFFKPENRSALTDSRSRLIVGDGRSHMRLSHASYDVIISEPSNPWMAGVAPLFTREFFEAAGRRLGPGGVLCQWAHTYDISEQDLRSIAATFRAVFPLGTIWLVGESDVLFIGSSESLVPRLARLATELPASVAEDLTRVGARDSFSLLSLYAGGPEALARLSERAVIQTDDRTALEFSAPRAIFGRTSADNVGLIRGLLPASTALPDDVRTAVERATPTAWRNRGQMLLRAEAYQSAYSDFDRAARANPDDLDAWTGLMRSAARLNRLPDALALVRAAAVSHPRQIAPRIALSRILASNGDSAGALDAAHEATRLDERSPVAREQLASVAADSGDAAALRPIVAAMQADAPDDEVTLYYSATLRFLEGDLAGAAGLADRVIRLSPGHARAQNLAGAAYANLGDRARARTAFEAAVRADPEDVTARVNLASFELAVGRPGEAASQFAQALLLDPASADAREGLREARRRLPRRSSQERRRSLPRRSSQERRRVSSSSRARSASARRRRPPR